MKISDIIDIICCIYNINKKLILSRSRKQDIVEPRHIAMYLARKITKRSFPLIAREFNKNHTSVVHAYYIIIKNKKINPAFAQKVDFVESVILSFDKK